MDLSYIYSSRKKSAQKEPGKRPNLVLISIISGILLVIAGVIIFFGLQVKTEDLEIKKTYEDCAQILNRSQDGKLVLSICVKKDGRMIVVWENLPEETDTLKIYRRKVGESSPSLWLEIPVSSRSGSTEVSAPGDQNQYFYQAEAVSKSGKVVWNSTTAPIQYNSTNPAATPSNTATPAATSTNNSTPPPPTTPPSTPPPQATSTPSPTTPPPQTTSTPPSPPAESNDTSTIYYYTPSGQISGTSTISTANFWVQHVNRKIEIGWQNLPANTDKIVVMRSTNESSGYATFLTVSDPNITSDFIRLDDHTINTTYYYKMSIYAGASLLGSYGPILLEALQ